jgi:uncharacterized OB-fold protein
MRGVPIIEGRYSNILDMYPIECREFNRIHPFYEELKKGRFTTTQCAACGSVAYPPRVICPKCYSEDLQWIDLPKKGNVLTVAEKWGGLPICFEPPLVNAWMAFPEGSPLKRMYSRVVNCKKGEVKEGDELQLVVFDVPSHPMDKGRDNVMVERVFFAFEPVRQPPRHQDDG